VACRDLQELPSEERDPQCCRQSGQEMQRTKPEMTWILKLPGVLCARGQVWDLPTAGMTREEGRSWVTEGPGGHVRNFDIYALGNPQSERAFFFFLFPSRSVIRVENVKKKKKKKKKKGRIRNSLARKMEQ